MPLLVLLKHFLPWNENLIKSNPAVRHLICLLLLVLTSCSFFGPNRLIEESSLTQLSQVESKKFLRTLEDQVKNIDSSRLQFRALVEHRTASRQFDLAAVSARPALLRTEFFVPDTLQLLFILTAHPDGVAAYDVAERYYYEAYDAALAMESFFGLPFQVEEVSMWLLGTFTPRARDVSLVFRDANGNLVVRSQSRTRKVLLLFNSKNQLATLEVWSRDRMILQTSYRYDDMAAEPTVPIALVTELNELSATLTLNRKQARLNDSRINSTGPLFRLQIPADAHRGILQRTDTTDRLIW